MSLLHLVIRNAGRNHFRSIIVFVCACLLAALPLTATVITTGGRDGLQKAMNRLGADVLVVPKNVAVQAETALLTGKPFPIWMKAEKAQQIAKISGVAQVSPQLYLSTLPKASCCSASELFIMAFDPASDFTLKPWLKQNLGRELALNEVVGGSRVFATNSHSTLRVYGTDLFLKGNLAPTGTGLDQSLFMTFETAREVARQSQTLAEQSLVVPANQVSAVLVQLEPGADPQTVAFYIQQFVEGTVAVQAPKLIQLTRQEMSGLSRIIIIMTVLIWLLAAGVAGLTFMLAAHERRRELGVLRALGASRGFVVRLLLAEAGFLGMAGALTGVFLSLAVAFWFHDAIVYFLNIPFLFPPVVTLGGLIAAALVLALAGVTGGALIPVWRVSRMEAAVTMRE